MMSLFGVVSIYVGSEKLSAKTAIVFHHYSSNGAKHATHNSSPYGVVAESDLGNVPVGSKEFFQPDPIRIQYIFHDLIILKSIFVQLSVPYCILIGSYRYLPVRRCPKVFFLS